MSKKNSKQHQKNPAQKKRDPKQKIVAGLAMLMAVVMVLGLVSSAFLYG